MWKTAGSSQWGQHWHFWGHRKCLANLVHLQQPVTTPAWDVAIRQSGLSLDSHGWLCYTCSFWLTTPNINKQFKSKWSLSPASKQSMTVHLKPFSMHFLCTSQILIFLPDFKYVLFFNHKTFFLVFPTTSYSDVTTTWEFLQIKYGFFIIFICH